MARLISCDLLVFAIFSRTILHWNIFFFSFQFSALCAQTNDAASADVNGIDDITNQMNDLSAVSCFKNSLFVFIIIIMHAS